MRGYRLLVFVLALLGVGAYHPEAFTISAILILAVVGVVFLIFDGHELGLETRTQGKGP